MSRLSNYISHPTNILLAVTLHFLTFLPDKLYLSIIYWCRMGKRVDWKNPKTFTEKIQWLKLYNRKPEYTAMVDKYEVKNYVADKIGDNYIIPTIGVWNTVNDIDFDSLPNQFVLKTTHGGGSGGVVICNDKSTFDIGLAKKKLQQSLEADIYRNYREWPYKNVTRRIIAEEYIDMPGKDDLTDYKFFCFNGKPQYIQVIQDRNTRETIDFFDTEWNHQEFVGLNPHCKQAEIAVPRPDKLEEMVVIATILSKNLPFVRVDLYNTPKGIFFGELTFFPASGIGAFTPASWNERLGDLIDLNDVKQEKN